MSISAFILRNTKDLSHLGGLLASIPKPEEKIIEQIPQKKLDDFNPVDFIILYFGFWHPDLSDDLTPFWREILLYFYQVQKKGMTFSRSYKAIARQCGCTPKTVQRFLEFNKKHKYFLFLSNKNFRRRRQIANSYILNKPLVNALEWLEQAGGLKLMYKKDLTQDELKDKSLTYIRLSMNRWNVHTTNFFIKPLPANTKEPMSTRIQELLITQDRKPESVHNSIKEMPFTHDTKRWLSKNFTDYEIAMMKSRFIGASNHYPIKCPDAYAKYLIQKISRGSMDDS